MSCLQNSLNSGSMNEMGTERAIVAGVEATVGAARVSVDGARLTWRLGGHALPAPAAGTGIAAHITDLVVGAVPPNAPAAQRERAIPVDQTQTSVIVDERWVVKIVGFWGSADRAAEILQRLNARGSTAIAELGGVLEWEHPEFGRSTLAIVTEYVPDSSDGWTWAVDDLTAHLRGAAPGQRNAAPPSWPTELGRLTAELHLALAADAAPGSAQDPRGVAREEAQRLLERALCDAHATDAADRRLVARQGALAAAIRSIPDHSAAPLVLPHGDYHVGQILRAPAGRYVVIDFDGDPQWGPQRRLQLDGAARDIAHLLCSIDMVASVAQRRLGRVDPRAWEWATRAQQEFLGAYRVAVPAGFLDERALDGLIAEQMLAEVTYARAFLPAWRYASDGAITHRYPPDTELPEEPWNPLDLPTI